MASAPRANRAAKPTSLSAASLNCASSQITAQRFLSPHSGGHAWRVTGIFQAAYPPTPCRANVMRKYYLRCVYISPPSWVGSRCGALPAIRSAARTPCNLFPPSKSNRISNRLGGKRGNGRKKSGQKSIAEVLGDGRGRAIRLSGGAGIRAGNMDLPLWAAFSLGAQDIRIISKNVWTSSC